MPDNKQPTPYDVADKIIEMVGRWAQTRSLKELQADAVIRQTVYYEIVAHFARELRQGVPALAQRLFEREMSKFFDVEKGEGWANGVDCMDWCYRRATEGLDMLAAKLLAEPTTEPTDG